MNIQQKLMSGFLGLSLLTGVVGAIAISQEHQSAIKLATIEAEEVARTIATYTTEEVGNVDEITPELAAELQEYTMALHEFMQRDIGIIGKDGRIKTDIRPEHIGKVFNDDEDSEIAKTIEDGKVRLFREISADYPNGIRQISVPVTNKQGEIIAALIFEYTPLYMATLQNSRLI
ncbi:MAG: hypothetical protein F6K19_47995 [Cyanothece sp. SIO1E1]|nr:hypothetical protein [Cyanothece sp. SIO1E1]